MFELELEREKIEKRKPKTLNPSQPSPPLYPTQPSSPLGPVPRRARPAHPARPGPFPARFPFFRSGQPNSPAHLPAPLSARSANAPQHRSSLLSLCQACPACQRPVAPVRRPPLTDRPGPLGRAIFPASLALAQRPEIPGRDDRRPSIPSLGAEIPGPALINRSRTPGTLSSHPAATKP